MTSFRVVVPGLLRTGGSDGFGVGSRLPTVRSDRSRRPWWEHTPESPARTRRAHSSKRAPKARASSVLALRRRPESSWHRGVRRLADRPPGDASPGDASATGRRCRGVQRPPWRWAARILGECLPPSTALKSLVRRNDRVLLPRTRQNAKRPTTAGWTPGQTQRTEGCGSCRSLHTISIINTIAIQVQVPTCVFLRAR
jgi:hypothetical protein